MQNLASRLIMPTMIFQHKEMCHGCKNEVEVYKVQIIGGPDKGKWKIQKKGCKCEDIELAKQALENHKKAKIMKLKELFNQNSLINSDLRKANFDNFEPKNEKQAFAKKVSMRYAEIFDLNEPRNLLFFGGFGIGKSHLAKSITDVLVERGFTTTFISVPKLLRKIRSTYNRDSEITEDQILTMMEQVDCLVLDDLGAEKDSDWRTELIFDIIDSRQGKHTIYTTNFSPENLIEVLGERNFSRVINADTTIIEMTGENQRLVNFQRRDWQNEISS